VLRGQHLGRGQQRGLAAGVGRGQHGPERHDGLARPDLTLDKPVHGLVAGHVIGDLAPHQLLVAGESEGQVLVESFEVAARFRHARNGLVLVSDAPLLEQGRLQHEGLVETQGVTGALPIGGLGGAVDELERLPVGEQSALVGQLGRHGVGHVAEAVEDELDRLGDLPGRDRRRRRIDGDRLLEPLGRGGRAVFELDVVEHLVVGVRELQGAPVVGDLSREDAASADGQLGLAPRLVEEGEGEKARAVGDAHLEDGAVARLHGALLDGAHLGHDGDVLPQGQLVERREFAAFDVATGVVAQQVADRDDAEGLREGGGCLAAQAARCELGVEDAAAVRRDRGRRGHTPILGATADTDNMLA
jgi:hypothetical protein